MVQPRSRRSTLHDDITTAVLVAGYELRFLDFLVAPARIEALERGLNAALADRGLELRLYVPGDTSTDPSNEVRGTFVLGRSVVEVGAGDHDPGAIDSDALQTAVAELPPLDKSFWREALSGIDGFKPPPSKPGLYLLSWGPLCYAAVYAGVAASRTDAHVYKFIANQNMDQEWSTAGVDGVVVASAELASVVRPKLSDAALGKADKLTGAGFWLICRYD